MISVAIISILMAVGIPAYIRYVAKSEISEGFSLAEGAKNAALEYYNRTGLFPTTNTQANFSGAAGKYVSSVQLEGSTTQAQIKVAFSHSTSFFSLPQIDAGFITFYSATTSTGNVAWYCLADGIKITSALLPPACTPQNSNNNNGTGNSNPDNSNNTGNTNTGSTTDPGNGNTNEGSGENSSSTPPDNGDITNPDGSITHTDGSTTYPDGSTKNPDGTMSMTDTQKNEYPSIYSAYMDFNASMKRYNLDVAQILFLRQQVASAQAVMAQYQAQIDSISDQNQKNEIINSAGYGQAKSYLNQYQSDLNQYSNDLPNAVNELKDRLNEYYDRVADFKRNQSATLPADFPSAPVIPPSNI